MASSLVPQFDIYKSVITKGLLAIHLDLTWTEIIRHDDRALLEPVIPSLRPDRRYCQYFDQIRIKTTFVSDCK